MTAPRSSPGAGPQVCPFVALAEDRDRRADAPDERNRCYAERAPRRRELAYQAEYCYSPGFASCTVFLAWAARNAAEPAYVTEAARKAWAAGVASPEGPAATAATGEASAALPGEELPPPTPEGGLFGPPDPDEAEAARGSEQLDWISASAWAEAPWDERAEREAEELELLAAAEAEEAEVELLEEDAEPADEATQAPKVPAALPMRRRKPPQEPIRSRGSGEWFYADPPGREPLVTRRIGITAPVMLAVLGLLVVSIVAFLLAMMLGGGDDSQLAAAASPSPAATVRSLPTPAPALTAPPSAEPSPAEVKLQTYTVKAGDVLSRIAAKKRIAVDVRLLQCMNGIKNPDRISVGQVLQIPPEGYTCPPGWRRATPEP